MPMPSSATYPKGYSLDDQGDRVTLLQYATAVNGQHETTLCVAVGGRCPFDCERWDKEPAALRAWLASR